MKSRLLFNEEPITINRLAAKVLGLNEAIVVQQIHYWLNINEKAKKNIYDGKVWTYNTYQKWHEENFDFWSLKTVQRTFEKLVKSNIIIKGNYNKQKYDRTVWVTLDYDVLEKKLIEYESKNIKTSTTEKNNKSETNVGISTFSQNDQMSDCNIWSKCPNAFSQNDQMDLVKMTTPIPETNTKISTEISITTQSEDKPLVVETNKELIESKTHLLLDSQNKIKKANSWDKDRLLKAIEIFISREGEYFSLLEKIYKDDKNFTNYQTKKVEAKSNINSRSYEESELESKIKASQKAKYENKNEDEDVPSEKKQIEPKKEEVLPEKLNINKNTNTSTFDEFLAELDRQIEELDF